MPCMSASSAASFDDRFGAKPPSSPTPPPMPWSCSHFLRWWKTSAPIRRHSAKLGRADRDDHELLEVDRVVGVRAAVEHVHHRHRAGSAPPRRRGSATAAGPAPSAAAARAAPATRRGSRSRRAASLFGVPSRSISARSSACWSTRVDARDRLGDLAVDVADGLGDALAQPRVAAVAQLGGLELAGRGARGHRGAAGGAGAQDDVDLDRRVPAGVEDLAGVDGLDLAHSVSPCCSARRAWA